jgi:Fe(3+) dicitrate transport protein
MGTGSGAEISCGLRQGAMGALVALALILCGAPLGFAGGIERASVSGHVIDDAGAAVRGAIVTVRRSAAGIEKTATTDDAGAFSFDGLVAGRYDVSTVAEGFSVATRAVELSPGEASVVEFALRPGSFTEEVAVVATTIVGTPEEAARIPGSFDRIDRETLETAHVFNFSEALRKVSGLTVRDEEGFGLRPNIGIRGLNPTRSTKVLLLEDGIPFTYAPYGDNASYYHPPVERYEAIEVLKGAGQIAYGPTTVGGVINYITPDPPDRPSGAISLTGGNKNYFNGEVSFGDTVGNTGYLLSFMRKQGEGARASMRFGLNDFNAKAVITISPRQTLTLKGSYYGEDSNVPYSGLRTDEYEENPRQNPFHNDFFYGDRVGLSARHALLLDEDVLLTTSVYGSFFRRHWWRQSSNSNERPNDALDPNCGGLANLDTDCGNQGRLRQYYFLGVEPRLTFNHALFGARNEAEVGVRIHYENQNRVQKNGPLPTSRDGVIVEDNVRRTRAFSAFVQNRFLFGRFTLTPGVRVERIHYERANLLAPNPDTKGFGVTGETDITQVIPGVGASFNVAESTTIFGGVHRGFSPPRTEDIINNTTGGSVELDPELSWNYEAGVRSLVRPGLRVDATFFRMDYENQVVPASIAGGVGATFTNGGETLHQGLELTSRVDTGTLAGSSHNVYARVAYTWVPIARFEGRRFSNIAGSTDVSVSGNRLPYAPEHLVNFNLGYSHPVGIDALVEAVRVGDQFADDINSIEPSADGQRGLIPAYTIWNLTVNYTPETIPTTFFVTVKNLADDTFIVDRARGAIPSVPRLVQAGLKFRF